MTSSPRRQDDDGTRWIVRASGRDDVVVSSRKQADAIHARLMAAGHDAVLTVAHVVPQPYQAGNRVERRLPRRPAWRLAALRWVGLGVSLARRLGLRPRWPRQVYPGHAWRFVGRDEARKRAVLLDTSDYHPDVRRMVRMWAREALDMVNATSRAITEETEVMNKMAATDACERGGAR